MGLFNKGLKTQVAYPEIQKLLKNLDLIGLPKLEERTEENYKIELGECNKKYAYCSLKTNVLGDAVTFTFTYDTRKGMPKLNMEMHYEDVDFDEYPDYPKVMHEKHPKFDFDIINRELYVDFSLDKCDFLSVLALFIKYFTEEYTKSEFIFSVRNKIKVINAVK